MTATNDIRRSFLDYFAAAGHAPVASAPLVPQNDPTLMFVNAGMVPFKNVFTGLETRPYSTAASSQKCVRAGGKHNDLDNVGYTARHHTFFEMLGNFSFGDYFKEQAIHHAWTLVHKEWGLPADRLTVTVFHTDDEAARLWRSIAGLPEDRIIRIATSDNFWSMGDTGPCGPCSEIFYDHGPHIAGGPPGSADEDGDRFVEIWNLVFMQYDQQPDGTRVDLPRPAIDTGMGLERIAAVLQGTHDNFETDTFRALTAASAELTGTSDTDPATRASHRIIADHLRAASFLMADGVMPANDGRGYVLRRIMRRAMRHAHLLGAREPLMHRLLPTLTAQMGGAYPELVRAEPMVAETLAREESRFRQTLDKGLRLLDDATAGLGAGDALPGDVAFKLYDTYGFPYDLTEDALRARGLGVDRAGFDAAMAVQQANARAAWKGSGEKASDDIWFDLLDRHGATEFTGYAATEGQGVVTAIIRDGAGVEAAVAGERVILLTNQTPFYAESGGQVGDAGTIAAPAGSGADFALTVTDTAKPLGRLHAHHATVDAGTIRVGDAVALSVDAARRDAIRANHSATHLLHAALRQTLGAHVAQKGSYVGPDRLRFDFSHGQGVQPAQAQTIEGAINARIREDDAVTTRLMTPDDAIAEGAMALFGEKYGDEVRVVGMGRSDDGRSGGWSVELCGGTHVASTGAIGLLRIVSEGAVASGVRRIEALTGEAARRHLTARDDQLRTLAASLKVAPDEVPARVATMAEQLRRMERELADAKKALALGSGGGAAAAPEDIGGIAFQARIADGLDPKELRGAVEAMRKGLGSGIAMLIAITDGKASVAVGVTDDLVAGGGAGAGAGAGGGGEEAQGGAAHDAVTLVRAAVTALGGQGGGGRPTMAQGGGPDADAAEAAIAAVRALLAG